MALAVPSDMLIPPLPRNKIPSRSALRGALAAGNRAGLQCSP